jgi:hypothetical protein
LRVDDNETNSQQATQDDEFSGPSRPKVEAVGDLTEEDLHSISPGAWGLPIPVFLREDFSPQRFMDRTEHFRRERARQILGEMESRLRRAENEQQIIEMEAYEAEREALCRAASDQRWPLRPWPSSPYDVTHPFLRPRRRLPQGRSYDGTFSPRRDRPRRGLGEDPEPQEDDAPSFRRCCRRAPLGGVGTQIIDDEFETYPVGRLGLPSRSSPFRRSGSVDRSSDLLEFSYGLGGPSSRPRKWSY